MKEAEDQPRETSTKKVLTPAKKFVPVKIPGPKITEVPSKDEKMVEVLIEDEERRETIESSGSRQLQGKPTVKKTTVLECFGFDPQAHKPGGEPMIAEEQLAGELRSAEEAGSGRVGSEGKAEEEREKGKERKEGEASEADRFCFRSQRSLHDGVIMDTKSKAVDKKSTTVW